MTTIVSLTQNAVQRDTRALKVGASMARFGYESVVLEGEPSTLRGDELPFDLVTLHLEGRSDNGEVTAETPGATAVVDGSVVGRSDEEPPQGTVARVGSHLPEAIKVPLRPAVAAVHRKLAQPLAVLGAIFRANLELLRKLPKADAYYLHSGLQFPAVYVKAKRLRARVIYDAHDANWALDPSVDESAPEPLTLRMMELIDRICARRANAFLTIGGGLAGLLEEHLGRRPVVVRNCHDFRLDEPCPTDVRSVAGVSEEAFLLVMTGAPKPGDTVDQAFTALTKLPDDVHLALVGNGQQGRREAVEAAGLAGRVHLLDAVPPTQVASFIRTADAAPILYHALSAAYLHSLPNRFFHAIAAGLPILYPPLPEIKAICDQYELGVEIDPESADSIEQGVLALSGDPQRSARYAAHVEESRAVLSWEHEESILSKLVEDALAGVRRR